MAQYAQGLRENRPADKVLEAAVATEPGTMTLYEVSDGVGITTGNKEFAEQYARDGFTIKEVPVSKRTLADILDNEAPGDVHWLKIDVEGMEHDVIKSWAGSSKRPWVVLLESTEPMKPEPNHHGWEPDLLALGYRFVYFDGLNRFYISEDHPELERFFTCGPNFFDDFVVTKRHWLLTQINEEASKKREKKGVAGLIKRLRLSTRPVRYWIKALFGRKQENIPLDYAPVPGMSAQQFKAVSDELLGPSSGKPRLPIH
jgi:FkbM family methyltransferase